MRFKVINFEKRKYAIILNYFQNNPSKPMYYFGDPQYVSTRPFTVSISYTCPSCRSEYDVKISTYEEKLRTTCFCGEKLWIKL